MKASLRAYITAWASALVLLLSLPAGAEEPGLLNLEVDHEAGQVRLRLDDLPREFLYVPALQSGAGSNDLGLDRGRLDRTRLVRFERFGDKVLLLEPNLKFRADSENPSERRAVREAFAQSVLAGFTVIEDEAGGVVFDLAPLLLSDITRMSTLIGELEQGSFEMDPGRSAVDTAGVRNYPENTLIPVIVTLSGSDPGEFLSGVTPTPDSLTVRVTHQFVALPRAGYQPRAFHPRSGYFDLAYRDYAAPLDQSLERRLIYRHRLEPGQTLRYYVDSGTPEPIRSALLEGASWWADAFQAAGFENGFEVDVLPPDVDPLDVRYNVIQWVHRSTRGWSYGSNVSDPRSGEIIKGHVSLGSLRVRQDQLIAEALTAPFSENGDQGAAARDMALARLRQLSAHEVGHTLGIDHNFSASFSGDRSVMDYPHPNLYLGEDGSVRLDRAYARGISTWDTLAVRYGYSQFPAGTEQRDLEAILREARREGILFMADRDARTPWAAHPEAHLWDNGRDVLDRLDELLAVRKAGLGRFSPAVVPDGTPLFELERRLVPLFLLHRYQVEAAAKLLGGVYYEYSLKDGQAVPLNPVGAGEQNRALDALTGLLAPESLRLPENLRYLIPPPVSGYSRDREFFAGKTGSTFDHLAPARAGADLVIRVLLQPQRLARMDEQHALDPDLPGIETVMDRLLDASWHSRPPRDAYLDAIRDEVNWIFLEGLIALASDQGASYRVRESATARLVLLADRLQAAERKGDPRATAAQREIRRFLDRPSGDETPALNRVPPGSPIGS